MFKEVLLFLLLSPGLVVTIPQVGKTLFFSFKTSFFAIIIHTLIFATALYYLSKVEAFQTTQTCYSSDAINGAFGGGCIIGAVVIVLLYFSYNFIHNLMYKSQQM